MSTDGLELVVGALTEEYVHRLDSDELGGQLISLQKKRKAYHDLLGSLGLLVLLTEIHDGVEVNLLGVLDLDLETTLVVLGILAVLLERDDDFLLRRGSVWVNIVQR